MLLPALYVGSAFLWVFLTRAEWISSRRVIEVVAPVYRPIQWYCKVELPGSRWFRRSFANTASAGRKLQGSNIHLLIHDGW